MKIESSVGDEIRRAAGLVLAVTAGLSLVLAMFVGVAVNSGPSGIRLAVAGPGAAVDQLSTALAAEAGPDAFEVTAVDGTDVAQAAIRDRAVDGAIVIGPSGATVLVAGAGSPAVSQLLTRAAAELGGAQAPPVTDVVPLAPTSAAGLPAGSLPMVLAGLALGAAAALSLRRRWIVAGAVVVGAVAVGLSFAGVLAWLGVTDGAYPAASSAIALTVGASAMVVAGSVRLLGAAGVALGALLLMIIGNPLSGIASSPRLLPAPWGEVGQWLPPGAGGTLLRTVAYFPEAAIAFPVWVLIGWAALGLAGVLVGRWAPHGAHGAMRPGAPATTTVAAEPVA